MEKCHTVLKDIRDDAGPLSWKGLCTTAWCLHFLTSYKAWSAKEQHLLHLCIYTILSQQGLLGCKSKM